MISVKTEDGDDEAAGTVLTPLVDVVFMLVVFLLLTANSAPFAIEVQAPVSENAIAQIDTNPIVIGVPDEEGTWSIDGRPLHEGDAQQVLMELLVQDQDRPVVILVEADSSAQTLIDAMDLARAAGAESVDINANVER